jgi:predicted Fe-S protein YdhL (DUF1289 family)
MSNVSPPEFSLPLTPCIGVCRLDERGHCTGCQRTSEEIARWSGMNDEERLYLMRVILPERRQR